MSFSSVKVEFINTAKIEKRKKFIKLAVSLKLLDEDSLDIYVIGALERYETRPNEDPMNSMNS